MAVDSTNTLTERELVGSLTSAAGGGPGHGTTVPDELSGKQVDGPLITVDDLEKALGEIEANEARVAPSAPAPPASVPAAAPPSPTPAAPASAAPTPSTADAAPAAVEKPLKFVIGKKPKPSGDTPESAEVAGRPAKSGSAAPRPTETQEGSEAAAGEAEPAIAAEPSPAVFRASRKAFRALETGLDLLSRPVARLGPNWLRLLGVFGVTTLLMSLTAMYLLPLLMPHEDAVTYLAARREAIAHPPPAPATDAGSGDAHGKKSDGDKKPDGHSGAKKDAAKAAKKPKSDGHGSGAKPKKAEKSADSGH